LRFIIARDYIARALHTPSPLAAPFHSRPPPELQGGRGQNGACQLRYVDEWRDDQMHGKGKYLSEEGEYDGHWEAGLREGQVRERWLCHDL